MEDFKVAEIVPVRQLGDIEDNFYHMCFSHIAWKSETYEQFYRWIVSKGKYVVMNSVLDCSRSYGFKELVDMFDKIQPAEIVIPYTIKDANKTLSEMFDWLKLIDLPCKQMAVPQGRSFEEWKACAYIMMQECNISTIGISDYLVGVTGDENARCQAVWYLDDLVNRIGRHDIEYHLLGVAETPKTIKTIRQISKRVRGCDSSFAYLATKNRVVIQSDTKCPSGNVNFFSDKRLCCFTNSRCAFESECGVIDNVTCKGW